jgi:hypothetical protein
MRTLLISTLLALVTATATAFAADPTPPAPAYTLSTPRVTQLKSATIIYQSLHIRVADTDTERKTIEGLMTKLAAAHVRITGGPIFIFPHLPTSAAAETDLDIAIPVPDKTPTPEGCQSRTLDSTPTVTAVYQGTAADMGQATSTLLRQLHTLNQLPTGELRTRSLYYEGDASPNNIVLLEIPVTPAQ